MGSACDVFVIMSTGFVHSSTKRYPYVVSRKYTSHAGVSSSTCVVSPLGSLSLSLFVSSGSTSHSFIAA